MTIGFDGSRAFVSQRTGTENYSFEILRNLAKIDTQHNVLIYLRPGSVVNSKDWPSNFKFKIIPNKRLWTQLGLAKATFTDQLDILFVPAHTYPLIHKPGLKIVMTVHDLGAEYLPKLHNLKQRLYLNWITHQQLKGATKLIAVSQATKKDLIKKVKVPANQIVVVYEGYNQDLYKPAKTDTLVSVLSQYKLAQDEYFLFVGTIQPRKNLERLIRAYHLFLERSTKPLDQQPKLILIGSKGWLSDQIYQLPKELGIEKMVQFLGYVPDEDMPAIYSGAKGFLFPSLFEGFGIPILEAFACGCPVLTSKSSSLPEVAGKAAILTDAYDIEDISTGIEKLLQKRVRQKLIHQGFEQLKKFSWQKAATETLAVLEKV